MGAGKTSTVEILPLADAPCTKRTGAPDLLAALEDARECIMSYLDYCGFDERDELLVEKIDSTTAKAIELDNGTAVHFMATETQTEPTVSAWVKKPKRGGL